MWVVLHHAQVLSGASHMGWPLLHEGALAVDLFMMLSGFLMTHHYLLRRTQEPWALPSTWKTFWLRRFFRIAPLYYLALLAAMVLGPTMGEFRQDVAQVWPTTATTLERYNDNSLHNLLLHASFIFGVLPDYAFRTTLPDWSIGLEMQFYLVFPFLMLAMRSRPLLVGCALVAASLALPQVAGRFMAAFPMPAFLPLKLYMFMFGIWVAMSRGSGRWASLVLALLLCVLVPVHEWDDEATGRVLLVAVFHVLMDDGSLCVGRARAWLGKLRAVLSCRWAAFAGDTSYAVYLVHLLILIPVSGWLATRPEYLRLGATLRFVLCVALTLPPTYALAWLLFTRVEQPGIAMGKRLLRQGFRRGPQAL